ncbi:hypothetical protein GCM10011316_13250 [Roseibium aquae]|uniref:HTH arsR-type domain-containing protein n=1 Tax=Roseibium aquae TaxID=1323746 RepID=A0A916TFL9_9HYPH|nr:metalloregulator ArsR/SmtB family transcription factor [Roseibium aquae]GGB42697.1 hypothetical protein GCM10011316_13250 [Roseibium aquae]
MIGQTDPQPDACDVRPNSFEDLARVYRALGHPARLAILDNLANRSQACCGDIVRCLPLAQSTVSQHLNVLKEAGLLECRVEGRSCHYRINLSVLRQAVGASHDYLSAVSAAPDIPLVECLDQTGSDTGLIPAKETAFD